MHSDKPNLKPGRYHSTERVIREQPQKRRREGHDSLIEQVAQRGAVIKIVLTSGEVNYGILKESDRFTISVYHLTSLEPNMARLQAGDDWEGLLPESAPTVFYKHAIESFKLAVRPKTNG